MEFFGVVIMWVGIVVCFVGGIFFLIAAFGESVIWGLACLFIPFVSLIFLFTHWQKAKSSFFIQLIGAVLIFIGTGMGGGFSDAPTPTSTPT